MKNLPKETTKNAFPTSENARDSSAEPKSDFTVEELRELLRIKHRFILQTIDLEEYNEGKDKELLTEMKPFFFFTRHTMFVECSSFEYVDSFITHYSGSVSEFHEIEASVQDELPPENLEIIKKFYRSQFRKNTFEEMSTKHLQAESDAAKAEILKEKTRGNLRFIPQSSSWITWDFEKWSKAAETGLPDFNVHKAINEISADLQKRAKKAYAEMDANSLEINKKDLENHYKKMQYCAKQWGSTAVRKNIISAFKQLPEVSQSAESLDSKPNHALCKNGAVIDMSGLTGARVYTPLQDDIDEFLVRDLMLTQQLNADFDANAKSPLWESFIARIMPDRTERRYLQQAIGYTLCGEITEKVAFFLYGHGDNGKSVFINTLSYIFGDLGKSSNKSLFVGKGQFRGADGNVIAGLLGIRFVRNDTEIAPDDWLNEECIKTISGNDGMLTARRVYEKEISFIPQCTLWMFGNHKPKLSAAMDPATLKRIKMLKFGQSIPKSEQDKQLTSKLQSEAAGILNWIIAGFNDWRLNGFVEPESVSKNVNEYAKENDILGDFIRDTVELTDDPTDKVSRENLFVSYMHWCAENNIIHQGTKATFSRRMNHRPEIKMSSSKTWCNMKIPFRPHTDRPNY